VEDDLPLRGGGANRSEDGRKGQGRLAARDVEHDDFPLHAGPSRAMPDLMRE